MDAPILNARTTFAAHTPLHIGAVGLQVRDLERLAGYYRDVIGLSILQRTETMALLGAGGVVLLELVQRPQLQPDDPRSAGLYHTAFLMPTRPDLARWVRHVVHDRVPITGASDHGVSEAFYLDDPEGNGIEVYCDRPAETWQWRDGMVAMPTERLDVEDILGESNPHAGSFAGAPDGLRIGHVHLRVGDLDAAEHFYRQGIGLDLTRRRNGASFMSSGRYHHHVAANVWQSAGAGRRDETHAGLAWFSMIAAESRLLDAVRQSLGAAGAPIVPIADGIETADPCGTRVRLTLGR